MTGAWWTSIARATNRPPASSLRITLTAWWPWRGGASTNAWPGAFDPEDVVQSVFRTFFHRVREGQFHLADQDDLCKLLMRITVHKTLRKVAFHQAARRNLVKEMGQGAEPHKHLESVPDREPSPEEAVTFLDLLEHFLSRLKPQERQIVELRLQGCSNEEIEEKTGIYDRKIRRILERVRAVALEQQDLAP